LVRFVWDSFVDIVAIIWLGVFVYGLVFPEYTYITDSINLGLLPVFIADLVVAYRRVGNLRLFVRKKWLDIIVAIPYFMILRLFRFLRILRVSRTVKAVKTVRVVGKSTKTQVSVTTLLPHIQKTIKAFKKTKRIIRKIKRK